MTSSRSRPIKITAISVLVCYIVLAVLIKIFSSDLSSAAEDARAAHFPVINYFLANGVSLSYANNYLSTFPGMHIYFASVAWIFGIEHLNYNSFAAFLIASPWAALYLFAIYKLTIAVSTSVLTAFTAEIIMLSPNYILASWIWPTTDLGMLACYLFMLLILRQSRVTTASRALAYSIPLTVAVLFRQSSAPLSGALFALGLSDRLFGKLPSWSARGAVVSLIPVIPAAVLVIFMIGMWNNLIPPDAANLRSPGINVINEVHMIALTGLLGWPFGISLFRLLSSEKRTMVGMALGALSATILCYLLLPLDFNRAAGRWGSLVWSVEAALGAGGPLFIICVLAIGFWIWGGIIAISWRERQIAPEIVLFLLFMSCFLVQSSSWERYIEVELLVTLTVFIFSRWPAWRVEAVAMITWFSGYATISMAKLLFGLNAA